MNGSLGLKACIGGLLILGGVVWLIGTSSSCGTAPTSFVVQGLAPTGNVAPVLTIAEPTQNLTKGRGEPFPIRWTDSDRDSNARISFDLIQTLSNQVINLVDNIPENDDVGPEAISVQTSLIPLGTYHIRGTIADDVNAPVSVFASVETELASQRVILTIVEPGQGPPTIPPTITITEPAFNLSVAQDDVLRIVVQPSETAPAADTPFDADSNITLYILLDTDQDPNNDDPANPDSAKIILLRPPQTVAVNSFDAIEFNVQIDLSTIPPRPGGEPYYIRATADDSSNPRVHQYAVGRINVAKLAERTVDLAEVGKTVSGARFYGFNPGANVGSAVGHVGNFDFDPTAEGDKVDDFVIIAQYGNPRNFGLLGEAYLVYGQNQLRFGGSLAVNTISETIDGVIFEAPPLRTAQIPRDPRTDGIANVSFVPDLTGDGRPELLFGLPHVHGAFDSMDYDPGDSDLAAADATANIEISIRQGRAQITVGDEDPVASYYSSVDDLVISSASPNTTAGSAADLGWEDNGVGQRRWALIKFRDVLDIIPDRAGDIDITTVSANLQFRVFNTGGTGAIFEALTDFDELTTFSTFAAGGNEPEAGVDYAATPEGGGELGSIDGGTADVVEVDVSEVVRRLIDNDLPPSSNSELRFIVVPEPEEGTDPTAVRSSEFSIDGDRPTLSIDYTRTDSFGVGGCYPDGLVNNWSDDEGTDPHDIQYYAGGMVVMVNSENRDNDPRLADAPARLATTSVALELVGQRTFILGRDELEESGGGGIFARAEDYSEEDRIAGARFIAGPYDYEDILLLRQPPRDGLFGQTVGSIGDLNNDDLPEIIISAPRNERHLQDLFDADSYRSTHWQSTTFRGSIVVIPGTDYNATDERDTGGDGTSIIPRLDQQTYPPYGTCNSPVVGRHQVIPSDAFEVFAEDIDDHLGDAQSAGDFDLDGLDDILCGAPGNDWNANLRDTGAAYIIYGRNVLSDFDLADADDLLARPPMLRIRGLKPGDQIGWRQAAGFDVNGDRFDDVFIASPTADFGGVMRSTCGGTLGLTSSTFSSCRSSVGDEVFVSDSCKSYDYDNDSDIDGDDEEVFRCLQDGGTDCCANLVDNGFVGVIFGGVFTDGDRTIDQIGTPDLPGVVFYGAGAGHRAGFAVSSAGDFNQDGFGDILIVAPGEGKPGSGDPSGSQRLGVVYLIFGGTHLRMRPDQQEPNWWNLDKVGCGEGELRGIVFLSPYRAGRLNEAAPTSIAYIGDVNNDGYDDIAIGNPKADYIDVNYPQPPGGAPTDAELGRRRDAGEAFVIYGNNFGCNRSAP